MSRTVDLDFEWLRARIEYAQSMRPSDCFPDDMMVMAILILQLHHQDLQLAERIAVLEAESAEAKRVAKGKLPRVRR